MEFTITNKSVNPIAVYVSQLDLTNEKLTELIMPSDMLKKVAYDYYWNKSSKQNLNTYMANYLASRSTSIFQYLGRCQNTDDFVELTNVEHVPDFGYVFYLTHTNNTSSLNVAKIPIRLLYSRNNTYLISVYNINFNIDPTGINQTHDELNRVLTIDYSVPGDTLSTFEIDWKPATGGSSREPWLFAGLVLIMVILFIIIIAASFYVVYSINKTVIHRVSKNITNVEKIEKVENPSLYLD